MASGDIPAGYLDSVTLRAYHVEINLAVEQWTFSGRVRIPVDIQPGPAHRVFYLHASAQLQLMAARVGGAPAILFRDRVTRIEVPEEAAVSGGTSTVIEICFEGAINKWRTDGLYVGGGKPGACENKKGSREEGAQGEVGEEREGRGEVDGEGVGDTLGNGGESAGAANTFGIISDNTDSERTLVFPAGAVLGTHLEPTHARELFPCVDLPRAKTVFRLTLRGVPRHLQAISNTSVLRIENDDVATAPVAGGESCPDPTKSVYFKETPVMPTYIFGFWVGDFRSVSTRALATTAVQRSGSLLRPPPPPPQACLKEEDAIQINVHVVRGVDLGGAEFALDLARRAFELFARLFSVRFPMPKLDLIALPRMHGLGMENFGAITFLQEYLLVTADTSFVRRRRIARLICHEVSHMWYGDIVTPESFDELWLKEGMARFFEYLAVDSLDPSYHVWNNFMSEVFFQAMLADSQKDSHPVVQQHNGDIASILESFDTITYCKGASVLRMLSHCVGLDRFLRGMGDYVASHQYGCATQEDLWDAMQGVCDRDGVAVNVRDLMQPWLTRPSFPVLRVRMTGNTLSITQQPFSFLAVPEVDTASGPDSTTAEAALRARREGAGEVAGAQADARSTNPPRTGAPTALDGNRSSVHLPAAGEAAAATESGATEEASAEREASEEEQGAPRPARSNASGLRSEGARSGGPRWVIPLRVRTGDGSRIGREGVGRAVEGGKERGASGSGTRPGEETHSLFVAETHTSVTLRGLSCEPIAVPPVAVGADAGDAGRSPGIDGEGECQGRVGGERRSYLVMNDGHSGFFTVQYECERSWGLALTAVEQGVLNECETMGFVHDLILALHEGVLLDRRASSLSIAGLLGGGGGGGGGGSNCDVPCLFARLREVVRLLVRDRGNPAWSTGQLFIWELVVMCASTALGDAYNLSRRQRELALAQRGVALTQRELALARERVRDSPAPRRTVSVDPAPAGGTAAVSGAGTGDEGAGSDTRSGPHAQRTETCFSEAKEGERRATAAAAAATAAATAAAADLRSPKDEEMKAAARRLHSVAAAVEAAVAEVEGHVGWHANRVGSGEEQAEEALQSLQAMKERLKRSCAQLTWARQHGLLRAFA